MTASSRSPRAGDWRALVARSERPSTALALGIELRRRPADPNTHWAPRTPTTAHPRDLVRDPGEVLLAVRPLLRSDATGNWIQSDATWDAVRRSTGRFDPAQVRWFVDFLGIARESVLSGTAGDWLVLDHVASRLLWTHLDEAAAVGIDLIPTQKHTDLMRAHDASVTVRLERASSDLRLRAGVVIDGEERDVRTVRAIGSSGLYAWEVRGDRVAITLGPATIAEAARALLGRPDGVIVPAGEREAFLAEGYPIIARQTALEIAPGVDVPVLGDPTAVLQVTHRAGNAVEYVFAWEYPGFGRFPITGSADPVRDADAEAVILEDVRSVWAQNSSLPFRPAGTLHEFDAADFVTKILPRLESDGVLIVTRGTPRTYRELVGEPEITVRAVESAKPDWFDLGFMVRIDGRTVPFQPLFTALAMRRTKLMLVDGTHLSLAHPALQRLRELIDEATELAEWETGPRISRHQIALWEEFEDLADQAEPAVAWRATVEALRSTARVPSLDPPDGLRARLRPYQQQGFEWLAFLHEHRLGGILADDMGLGKTVQVLGLLQRIRERGDGRPMLVVAPTSVVGAWAEEAARFAPGLRVAVVERTEAAGAQPLTGVVADADVVVTSYTLVRLDERRFAEIDWAIKILDEAQFVKNPATGVHRAIAAVGSDTTFAVTGTPLENSLTELWALLQLTAPGLFPSARRFREEYVQPIEQGKVPENEEGAPYRARRLQRLRRRIRPLLLRRTKELVAADLPAKQQQVLHVELSRAQRTHYDTVLQRERQKVLGLLQDLDRNRFIVFRSLTLLRMLSLAPALIDPADAGLGSAKLDLLLDRVAELRAEGHRALVFSQFTSFLQLAAERLERAGVPYSYLDGSTARRAEVVDEFRSGTQPVFLISLKAGGFGLTITEADYVFLLDPWWNPASEAQAIDRTHRIGQDKQVFVYRMIATGTIEEKVLALQERKARLFTAVLDDDELFAKSLTADDIRGLFDA